MEKIITCLLSVMWCISVNAQESGWFSQTSGTSQNLTSVRFVDDSTGWIVGDSGTILHTENKGGFWMIQNCPSASDLLDVDFVDTNLGWAVAKGGDVLKTSDGGLNWDIQTNLLLDQFGVDFINDSTGWTAANFGAVFFTRNGGTTWDSSNTGSPFDLKDVFFLNCDTGFVIGGNTFLRTEDGGSTWQYVGGVILEDTDFRDVHFATPDSGWIAASVGNISTGFTGAIALTIDGGDNFLTLVGLPVPMQSVFFTDSRLGWAAGSNGTITHSSDGGLSWNSQTSGTTESLSGIFFTNDSTGWAVGRNGVILSTTSGGITAVDTRLHEGNPTRFWLNQNHPNPFNPSTRIRYALAKASLVSLKIYNILGQEVATLVDADQPAGIRSVIWNGKNALGFPVGSGVYFYRIEAGDFAKSRKMLLLK